MTDLDWTGYINFRRSEFECRCGCGRALMNAEFMTALQALRTASGVPMVVSSGYRCPAHNMAIASSGPNGPHTTGKAADILVQRADAHKILMALTPVFTGIGLKQKGTSRFIHLDSCSPAEAPRPTVWTY